MSSRPIPFKYIVRGLPVVALATIAAWWNAPALVNSSYFLLGFSLDLFAVALVACYAYMIWRRCKYAMRLQKNVYRHLHIESDWTEYLDCPQLSDNEIWVRLDIYKDNPLVFDRPLNVLFTA